MRNAEHERLLRKAWGDLCSPTTGGLVIHDVEVAHCLIRWAEAMHLIPCSIDDCEACNLDRAIWWDWSNSLSGPVRIRMQRIMWECEIPLPPGPWEEIYIDAVPAPRQ